MIVAGGAPVELALCLRTTPLRVSGVGELLPPLPFGALAVALFDPGGRPGAGTLTGGTEGAEGVRLVELADGSATISYAPPAEAAADVLVVALDDGSDGLGVEIGRLTLKVREA